MSHAIQPHIRTAYADLGDLVASNLRAEVARRRLSQEDMARYLGMSQQAVSDRLRGKVKLTISDLGRFADMFGVDAMDLLSGPRVPNMFRPPRLGWSNEDQPHTADAGGADDVRHQGLEPRTHWLRASAPTEVAVVVDLDDYRAERVAS